MRILISGICGFVGSAIARTIRERMPEARLIGMDNLSRRGSELNWRMLKALGVELRHADVRQPSDFEPLPAVDWVIDAAANPSVLAGRDGATNGRQLRAARGAVCPTDMPDNTASTVRVLSPLFIPLPRVAACRRMKAYPTPACQPMREGYHEEHGAWGPSEID